MTFKLFARGHITTTTDEWTTVVPTRDSHPRTGITTFLTMDPPADQDVPSSRVESQIADMASSRPWAGGEPPQSIYVDGRHSRAVLMVSGARRDTAGCLYPGDGDGERCAKPKIFGPSDRS